MRRLSSLAFAAAFALTSVAAAPRLLADFSGRWDVVVQGPSGPMSTVLTLAHKGDSVSGQFESEMGTAPVAGVTKGDSVMFSFSMDAGGQVMSLTGVGALKDKDHVTGKIIAEGMGEFPFEGERKAP